jgi:hypothetical protein
MGVHAREHSYVTVQPSAPTQPTYGVALISLETPRLRPITALVENRLDALTLSEKVTAQVRGLCGHGEPVYAGPQVINNHFW